MGSSWTLLRQYHLPDSYRLTQNALAKFSGAMNEEDPSKRQRMLKYLESDFAMYAPYWFYRAKVADEAGDSDEAGKCFAKFAEVWRPVLRKDPYRVEEMKYRIKGLVTREETGEILKCLEEMRAHTELEDWANNIFAGMVYFSLGYKEKAEECVMCNIDFGYEREESGKILAEMKTTEPPMKDDDFLALFEDAESEDEDAKSVDTKKIETAILNGANVNVKNEYGETALMWAVRNVHAEVTEILLKHGADVNAKDYNGGTALMSAVYYDQPEVVELLLKHGANVNAKDNRGGTALTRAAEKNQPELLELLLKHGANVNAKDNYGKTALEYAGGHKEIAEILRKYGAEEKGFFSSLFSMFD